MDEIAVRVSLDLTAHLRLGDEMRAAGLHRQADCYDIFLEGRMPYDIMVRHFGRQHAASFRKHAGIWDSVKQLGGKTKKIVRDQLGKWQQKLTESVKESLPALQELKSLIRAGGERIAPDDLTPAFKQTLTSVRETAEQMGEGF